MAQPTLHEEAMRRLIANLDEDQRKESCRWSENVRGDVLGRLLTQSRKQPTAFRDIVGDTLDDEPVLDHITDVDAREQIHADFIAIIRRVKSPYQMDMAFATVLLVAPLRLFDVESFC
ncbi:hypothetical protein ACQKWADRAFT_269758 [Trichoderma austrokoningii]